MERLVLALTFRDIICISCFSAAMIGYPGKKQLREEMAYLGSQFQRDGVLHGGEGGMTGGA